MRPTLFSLLLVCLRRVHLRVEDKIIVRLGRDGGLQSFELSGLLTLRVSDEKFGRIKVELDNNDSKGIQLQTHPNVDKELFKTRGQIGLKNPSKPFPLNTDVGVLKWRWQTQDESSIPLISKLVFSRKNPYLNRLHIFRS